MKLSTCGQEAQYIQDNWPMNQSDCYLLDAHQTYEYMCMCTRTEGPASSPGSLPGNRLEAIERD